MARRIHFPKENRHRRDLAWGIGLVGSLITIIAFLGFQHFGDILSLLLGLPTAPEWVGDAALTSLFLIGGYLLSRAYQRGSAQYGAYQKWFPAIHTELLATGIEAKIRKENSLAGLSSSEVEEICALFLTNIAKLIALELRDHLRTSDILALTRAVDSKSALVLRHQLDSATGDFTAYAYAVCAQELSAMITYVGIPKPDEHTLD